MILGIPAIVFVFAAFLFIVAPAWLDIKDFHAIFEHEMEVMFKEHPRAIITGHCNFWNLEFEVSTDA